MRDNFREKRVESACACGRSRVYGFDPYKFKAAQRLAGAKAHRSWHVRKGAVVAPHVGTRELSSGE